MIISYTHFYLSLLPLSQSFIFFNGYSNAYLINLLCFIFIITIGVITERFDKSKGIATTLRLKVHLFFIFYTFPPFLLLFLSWVYILYILNFLFLLISVYHFEEKILNIIYPINLILQKIF